MLGQSIHYCLHTLQHTNTYSLTTLFIVSRADVFFHANVFRDGSWLRLLLCENPNSPDTLQTWSPHKVMQCKTFRYTAVINVMACFKIYLNLHISSIKCPKNWCMHMSKYAEASERIQTTSLVAHHTLCHRFNFKCYYHINLYSITN